MMKIKLTIQEIIEDFEKLVRCDEKLGVMFDFEKADDEDIEKFFKNMEKLARKYLPNYEDNISRKYFSDEISLYDKALMLYNILYENFREIFYQLI